VTDLDSSREVIVVAVKRVPGFGGVRGDRHPRLRKAKDEQDPRMSASLPVVADSGADDAALIERSRHEPDQFAVIYDRHFAEIYRYVARRIGGQVADDVAAEVFVVAFRRRERFDPLRGRVRPWLYGIATNLIGQHRRDEKRRYDVLARVAADGAVEGPEDRVATRVTAQAVHEQLTRALGDLAHGDRDVMLLAALGGLGYDEIAEALGIPGGTVASRLHRARRKLRKALGGADPTRTTEEESADGSH
jgi:RNA polymerase sigma factor (sigma-70 family)